MQERIFHDVPFFTMMGDTSRQRAKVSNTIRCKELEIPLTNGGATQKCWPWYDWPWAMLWSLWSLLKKSSKWPQSVMSQAWTTQSNNLSVLLFGSFLFLLLQKSKMPRSSSSSIIHHVPISNSSSIAPEPPLVVTPSPCFLSFLSPGVQQQASPCFYPKSMYRENMILQLCTYTWTYIYIHIYTCTVHSVLGRLSRLINSMIICCALHGKSFCGSLLRMDTLVTLFVGA